MTDQPTKIFPCDCVGGGITVTKYSDTEDISEGEVFMEEDKKFNSYPCSDCGGSGKTHENAGATNLLMDYTCSTCNGKGVRYFEGSPFIQLSFWEYGHPTKPRWSWWWKLKIAWYVFRKGSPWPDMVILNAKTAKNFANHILYLLAKHKEKRNRKNLLVKEDD